MTFCMYNTRIYKKYPTILFRKAYMSEAWSQKIFAESFLISSN